MLIAYTATSMTCDSAVTMAMPVATGAVRAAFSFRDTVPPTAALTDRELSVLRLVAGGYSNKEIARTLFLAEGTVKNYVSTILLALDVKSRSHLISLFR